MLDAVAFFSFFFERSVDAGTSPYVRSIGPMLILTRNSCLVKILNTERCRLTRKFSLQRFVVPFFGLRGHSLTQILLLSI
jgi:hypothetical protein